MKYIDYVFYRIYSFYQRKEKNGPDPELRGIMFIFVFTLLIILEILISISAIINSDYLSYINEKNGIPIILVILAYYIFRYKNKKRILEISGKWKNESREIKRKKAYSIWTICMILIFLFFLLLYTT